MLERLPSEQLSWNGPLICVNCVKLSSFSLYINYCTIKLLRFWDYKIVNT